MRKKTTASRALALLLALVLTMGALAGCGTQTQTASQTATATADKTITVQVIHGDESAKDFTIATDAETLREAMDQEGLIEGTESEYGLYVTTVDGETADESKQEWWCLTKDGEEWMNGVDSTEIADGDRYEFTLTTGW